MESLFRVDTQAKVLICTTCCFAVPPQQVSSHLRAQHQTLHVTDRNRISEEVSNIASLAQHPADVRYPHRTSPPIPGIPIHTGYRCLHPDPTGVPCGYIVTNVTSINKHCRKKHGWVNPQTRGGDKRSQDKVASNAPYASGVPCQLLFKGSQWKKYFEVQAPPLPTPPSSAPDGADDFIQGQIRALAQNTVQLQENHSVEGFDAHRSEIVPWLRTSGIERHLRGLLAKEIASATAMPDPVKEPQLHTIVHHVRLTLHEARAMCYDADDTNPRRLSHPIALVLNCFSANPNQLSNGGTKPWNHSILDTSLDAYIRYICRALCYLYRVGIVGNHFTDQGTPTPHNHIIVHPDLRRAWVWVTDYLHDDGELITRDGELAWSPDQPSPMRVPIINLLEVLFCEDNGSVRFRSPLVSFAAMLAFDTKSASWLAPHNFGHALSALIWIAQLTFFASSVHSYDEAGRGQSILNRVIFRCGRSLHNTSQSAASELVVWRALVLRVAREEISPHRISWNPAQDTLTYGSSTWTLKDLSRVMQSEFRRCAETLRRDLLLAVDVPPLDCLTLLDNDCEAKNGWHFADDPRNQSALHGAGQLLLLSIARSDVLKAHYIKGTGANPRWSDSAIASYEEAVQTFLKHLAVLIHLSGGQPVRGPEFCSVTWKNTQAPRSIFIRNGMVMVHIRYSKLTLRTGLSRANVKFLQKLIGQMLLHYIVYVQPLRQSFLTQSNPGMQVSPFLFSTHRGVWKEEALSSAMREASAHASTASLHISNWRQITVAIVKTHFAEHSALFPIEEDGDGDTDESSPAIAMMNDQRNHLNDTANRLYANQSSTASPFAFARQAGNLWDAKVVSGYKASMLWHQFWALPTLFDEVNPRAPPLRHSMNQSRRPRVTPVRHPTTYTEEDLLSHARAQFQSPELTWKSSQQRDALLAIAQRREEVVAILPTGGGKSLLFILPATLPSAGVTILILPLVALRANMRQRLHDADIDFVVWHGAETEAKSVVVVSAEAACTTDFLVFAKTLQLSQRLERIVMDECHLTVTAIDYRPRLAELKKLRQIDTQVVYLTATLPPAMEREFYERNAITQPVVIRAPTNRPEIMYDVQHAELDGQDFMSSCVSLVQGALDSPIMQDGPSRLIVYTQTRVEANALAAKLACVSFTAQSGTEDEKAALLQTWLSPGGSQAIVATRALSEGFDYPHVRMVFHIGAPDSLVLFAQESGRAGRDGSQAYSFVTLPPGWTPDDVACPVLGEGGYSALDPTLRAEKERYDMHQYLAGRRCYRTSLSEHLDDPKARVWCGPDDETCGVCDKPHSEPAVPPQLAPLSTLGLGTAELYRQQRSAYHEIDVYRRCLAALEGRCAPCLYKGRPFEHERATCHFTGAGVGLKRRAMNATKGRNQAGWTGWLPDYHSCFWCYHPQDICPRVLQPNRSGPCEFPDIVLPLCAVSFGDMGPGGWLAHRIEKSFDDYDKYIDWLGHPTTVGGMPAIQANRVVALMLSATLDIT